MSASSPSSPAFLCFGCGENICGGRNHDHHPANPRHRNHRNQPRHLRGVVGADDEGQKPKGAEMNMPPVYFAFRVTGTRRELLDAVAGCRAFCEECRNEMERFSTDEDDEWTMNYFIDSFEKLSDLIAKYHLSNNCELSARVDCDRTECDSFAVMRKCGSKFIICGDAKTKHDATGWAKAYSHLLNAKLEIDEALSEKPKEVLTAYENPTKSKEIG